MLRENPKYQTFIKSWCSKDGYRTQMLKPTCFDGGWVCATDSYKLIWTYDPDYKNFENRYIYSETEGIKALPVVEKFSEFYGGVTQPIGRIKIKEIEEVFEKIKLIPEFAEKYIECPECDGFGTSECRCCGSESDCENCDGEGEIPSGTQETGHYHFPENHYFNVDGVHLSMKTTRELIDNLLFVGISELEIFSTNDYRCFFGIPGEKTFLLVMGCYVTDAHESQIFEVQIHSKV